MHRFWKWSKLIAPAPKPDRLLTPVRKQNLSPTTLYICMLKIREVKHSCRSWYSEISNSFFSILLSLLHSSIVLVQFEFALFLSALINFLSCLFYYIFPLQSIHYSRTLLWFIICCVLPTPPPHSAPSFFFHSLTHHFDPSRHRHHTLLVPTSLAGHWPDAQPRAGWCGPVLYGLARPS